MSIASYTVHIFEKPNTWSSVMMRNTSLNGILNNMLSHQFRDDQKYDFYFDCYDKDGVMISTFTLDSLHKHKHNIISKEFKMLVDLVIDKFTTHNRLMDLMDIV